MLQQLDLESLRAEFRSAAPFPYVKIENFIAPMKAKEIAASYRHWSLR